MLLGGRLGEGDQSEVMENVYVLSWHLAYGSDMPYVV